MTDWQSLQARWPSTWRELPQWSDLPPGWIGIVERLSAALEPIVVQLPDWQVSQVKEKFGGLRFYADCSSEEADRIITAAERESVRTCQDCGAPGERRGTQWIWTLCDACDAARVLRVART